MRKSVVLITGAGGEIGHALVRGLAEDVASVITVDLNPLDTAVAPLVRPATLLTCTIRSIAANISRPA